MYAGCGGQVTDFGSYCGHHAALHERFVWQKGELFDEHLELRHLLRA
jgi:hypothetical protein